MKYYQELIEHMDRSMRAHPRSTVVMDSANFKIIAAGRNIRTVMRKLKQTRTPHGVPVIFQRPDERVVWILATRSRP